MNKYWVQTKAGKWYTYKTAKAKGIDFVLMQLNRPTQTQRTQIKKEG